MNNNKLFIAFWSCGKQPTLQKAAREAIGLLNTHSAANLQQIRVKDVNNDKRRFVVVDKKAQYLLERMCQAGGIPWHDSPITVSFEGIWSDDGREGAPQRFKILVPVCAD